MQATDRKINRYSAAILTIQNHLLWWDSLTAVDQNSQTHINRLVSVGEAIKTGEVDAWADAGRHREESHAKAAGGGDGQGVRRDSTNDSSGKDYQLLHASP